MSVFVDLPSVLGHHANPPSTCQLGKWRMALQRLENANASQAVSREAGGRSSRELRGDCQLSVNHTLRAAPSLHGAGRVSAFMQLSQPPDSAQLLRPFSYATAKRSCCFQLQVPRKAAQQPQGPSSGMTACRGRGGVRSVPPPPSEPCSPEQEAGGCSYSAPCSPSCPTPAPGT